MLSTHICYSRRALLKSEIPEMLSGADRTKSGVKQLGGIHFQTVKEQGSLIHRSPTATR